MSETDKKKLELFDFIIKHYKRFLKDNGVFKIGCADFKRRGLESFIKNKILFYSSSYTNNYLNSIFIQTFWCAFRDIFGGCTDASIAYIKFLDTHGKKIEEEFLKSKIPGINKFLCVSDSIRGELSYLYEATCRLDYHPLSLADCKLVMDKICECENEYGGLSSEIMSVKNRILANIDAYGVKPEDLKNLNE